MAAKNYNKRYFEFNLIPPKSKEEIEVLVDRDNTLFYSFLLIFFGFFLFFILNIVKTVFVEPALDKVKNNITAVDTQISNFDEIKGINGELFIKSQALEPILDKDVEVTKVLQLEADIRKEFPNLIEVIDYARKGDGSFSFTFNITNASKVTDIADYLEKRNDVSGVFLESVNWVSDQNGPAEVNISFFVSNLD